jgi:hypothetical protein
MIVERLYRALSRVQARVLPQNLLGQAINYALGQWSTLTVYLDNGRVEIDNNLVENALRPTALGTRRTGSSSAPTPTATAAPSSTPSSRSAADAASFPKPT